MADGGRPRQGEEGAQEARLGLHDVNWNVDKAYGRSDGFQTGSSFKAFTLAAALKSGMTLNDTSQRAAERRRDRPYRDCSGARSATSRGSVTTQPQNDERGAVGNVSLYKATAASINTAFAKLEQQVSDLQGRHDGRQPGRPPGLARDLRPDQARAAAEHDAGHAT